MAKVKLTGVGELTFRFKIVETGDSENMIPEDVMIEIFKKSFKEYLEDELEDVQVVDGAITFTVEEL